MSDLRTQLISTLRKQFAFSKDYSPLYASLFAAFAQALVDDRDGLVATLLLNGHDKRRPLDLSLLIAAALHRDVLLKVPVTDELARYYPSVGGDLPAGFATPNGWHLQSEFLDILHDVITIRQYAIRHFIDSNEVQTNETGRGLSWLLPMWLAGWSQINLVDLGASAGLNLAAEQRLYRLVDGQLEDVLTLGFGSADQFVVFMHGEDGYLKQSNGRMPHIMSRIGCDFKPFYLRTPHDEITLASFIWADQIARLARLWEGIEAYRTVAASSVPIHLYEVLLPEALPDFLKEQVSNNGKPVICYNTYIRMYLHEKGRDLRHSLETWSRSQDRPLVWIQWEPPSSYQERLGKAPEIGWLAWTIDLWHGEHVGRWHIAWVHPHGHSVYWLPGLEDWIKLSRSISNE